MRRFSFFFDQFKFIFLCFFSYLSINVTIINWQLQNPKRAGYTLHVNI